MLRFFLGFFLSWSIIQGMEEKINPDQIKKTFNFMLPGDKNIKNNLVELPNEEYKQELFLNLFEIGGQEIMLNTACAKLLKNLDDTCKLTRLSREVCNKTDPSSELSFFGSITRHMIKNKKIDEDLKNTIKEIVVLRQSFDPVLFQEAKSIVKDEYSLAQIGALLEDWTLLAQNLTQVVNDDTTSIPSFQENNSPLIISVKINNSSFVETILKTKAFTKYDLTHALIMAAYLGFNDLINIFLSHKTFSEKEILEALLHSCHLSIKPLIKAGAPLNKETDFNLKFCLHKSAREGYIKKIDVLLKYGAFLEIKDQNEWTALHHAVDAKKFEAVEFLLAKGANHKATTKDGKSPLDLAIELPDEKNKENLEKIRSLLLRWEIEDLNITSKEELQKVSRSCSADQT